MHKSCMWPTPNLFHILILCVLWSSQFLPIRKRKHCATTIPIRRWQQQSPARRSTATGPLIWFIAFTFSHGSGNTIGARPLPMRSQGSRWVWRWFPSRLRTPHWLGCHRNMDFIRRLLVSTYHSTGYCIYLPSYIVEIYLSNLLFVSFYNVL